MNPREMVLPALLLVMLVAGCGGSSLALPDESGGVWRVNQIRYLDRGEFARPVVNLELVVDVAASYVYGRTRDNGCPNFKFPLYIEGDQLLPYDLRFGGSSCLDGSVGDAVARLGFAVANADSYTREADVATFSREQDTLLTLAAVDPSSADPIVQPEDLTLPAWRAPFSGPETTDSSVINKGN